ncbi:hypothetical protein E2562_030193 [Oryza meyeriana var. granulata]|uniref:Uncharacterized protein n=1 Tax=Oryza meyeriana var. granulata TaxID=110450 RepID=A0A6G1D934_9ORYZ|nr:hypothetical protein E2562_030193 [Oryza meyeriana var. granulata]
MDFPANHDQKEIEMEVEEKIVTPSAKEIEMEEKIVTPAVPVGWQPRSIDRSQSGGGRGQIEMKKTPAAARGRIYCFRCWKDRVSSGSQSRSRGESMPTSSAPPGAMSCIMCGHRVVRLQKPKENMRLRPRSLDMVLLIGAGGSMPGRFPEPYRHHHHFFHHTSTARDFEELVRLKRHMRNHLGTGISRSVYGRNSRVMGFAAKPDAKKDASCPPAAADSEAMEGEAESESPQQQHSLADVLASSLGSCTL